MFLASGTLIQPDSHVRAKFSEIPGRQLAGWRRCALPRDISEKVRLYRLSGNCCGSQLERLKSESIEIRNPNSENPFSRAADFSVLRQLGNLDQFPAEHHTRAVRPFVAGCRSIPRAGPEPAKPYGHVCDRSARGEGT